MAENRAEILFNFGVGGSRYCADHPCPDLQPIMGRDQAVTHFMTHDSEWFAQAEKEGAVQRVGNAVDGMKKITIIEGALETDPVEYQILVQVEGCEGTITLSEGELFIYSKFKQKIAAAFQVVVPDIKKQEWGAMLAPLLRDADRIRDGLNESPAILEVINKIENAEVVKDKKDLVSGAGNRVWFDVATATLYILSKDLEPIAEKYKIELRRLAELLSGYRKGSARQERIGKKRFQLWVFKPELFQLNGRDMT